MSRRMSRRQFIADGGKLAVALGSSLSLRLEASTPFDLVLKGGTHGDTLRIIPEERMQAMAKDLPHTAGRFSDHFENFVLACRGREPARSSFDISGPLTQVFLLGVIAQRIGGRLEFDPVRRRFTNSARANQLLKGLPPRQGWRNYYRATG